MAGIEIFRKFKPKARILPPSEIPSVEGFIKMNAAISLIADRCKPKHESLRSFRNKVSGAIGYATEARQLKLVAGGFIFGELMAWAKSKPRWVIGLEPFLSLHIAQVACVLPTITASMRAISLPLTLEECHQALIDADRRIDLLQTHLNAAEGQLEDQRPLVQSALRMRRPKRK